MNKYIMQGCLPQCRIEFATQNMENFILILLLVVLLSLTITCTTSLKYCYEGTYEVKMEDGYLACELCPEGTYMPEYDHRHRACYNCTQTDSDLEVVVCPCTRERDTIIHCVEGYYGEKGKCKRCTECRSSGSCEHNNDGYPKCTEGPLFCMQGQYLIASTCECRTCPSNTYMPFDHHITTECFKCPKYFIPNHSKIIHQCNKTHPPVVACEHGFYKDYTKDAIGCRRCTDCTMNNGGPYIGRQCNREQNTVCCPHPNITVVDTPDSPICPMPVTDQATPTSTSSPVMIFCGTDQYLHYNPRDNSVTCQPCPDGTYMNETDHRETSCKSVAKCICATSRSHEKSPKFSERDNENLQITNTGPDTNDVYFICFVVSVILFVISFVFNIFCICFKFKSFMVKIFLPCLRPRSNTMSSKSTANDDNKDDDATCAPLFSSSDLTAQEETSTV